jgi:hypothetical protein
MPWLLELHSLTVRVARQHLSAIAPAPLPEPGPCPRSTPATRNNPLQHWLGACLNLVAYQVPAAALLCGHPDTAAVQAVQGGRGDSRSRLAALLQQRQQHRDPTHLLTSLMLPGRTTPPCSEPEMPGCPLRDSPQLPLLLPQGVRAASPELLQLVVAKRGEVVVPPASSSSRQSQDRTMSACCRRFSSPPAGALPTPLTCQEPDCASPLLHQPAGWQRGGAGLPGVQHLWCGAALQQSVCRQRTP